MDLKLSLAQIIIDSINVYFTTLEIASPKDFPDCLSNMCISSIPYVHVYVSVRLASVYKRGDKYWG